MIGEKEPTKFTKIVVNCQQNDISVSTLVFVQSNGELPGNSTRPQTFHELSQGQKKTFRKAKKLERMGISLFDASLGWDYSILA